MSSSKDSYIHAFQFDLFHLSEKSHHHIENRFVKIFDQNLRRIIQNYFTEYADNEEIFIEKLELDLGELYQEDLEQQLPLVFEKALEEKLKNYFKNVAPPFQKQQKKTLVKSNLSPLFYYLKYGLFPWYYNEKDNFLKLWKKSIQKKNFIAEAYRHQWKTNEINRLSLQLIPLYWKKTLQAFVSQQTEFILNYQQEILHIHKEKRNLLSLSKHQLNFLVKKFILTYIFMTQGSFFSKKQFLENQLEQIANHYAIEYKIIVELFINHIKNIQQPSFLQQELYMLLCRLSENTFIPILEKEKIVKTLQASDLELYFQKKLNGDINKLQQLQGDFISQELQKEIKRKWLSPLQEKKLYHLLQLSIGETKTQQLKKYHQLLYKQREFIKKKPLIPNFKKAVWEFTIDYFSQLFSSHFQLKSFVIYHTKAISSQYNLSHTQFLNTLIYCAESFFALTTSHLELFYIIKQLSVTSLFQEKPKEKGNLSPILKKVLELTRKKGTITSEEILQQIQLLAKTTNNQSTIELIYLLMEKVETSKKMESSTRKSMVKELNFLLRQLNLETFLTLLFAEQLVILSSATSEELRQLNKHQLSFYTFKKILANEVFLSVETIKIVQKNFQQKEIRTNFFKKWIFTLTMVEQESLIKIFNPNQYLFLLKVWQLLSTEFPQRQYKKLYLYFFNEFILNAFTENPSSFWKNQLPKMANQSNLSSTEFLERLLKKNLINKPYSQQFDQHFLYLSKLAETSGNSFLTLANIKTLKKIFPKEKFLAEIKKDWEALLISLKILTELPYRELWEKQLFLNITETDFTKVIQHFPKEVIYFLRVLQQRYRLKKTWRKFRKIYRLNCLELFLFTTENSKELEKYTFNFSSISKQEINHWSQLLLTQKNYFEMWLERPISFKKQLFTTSLVEKTSVLQEFYVGLEKIYTALPENERPHSFKIFETHFWKVLFYSIQKKETQAWSIIANWFASLKLQNLNHLLVKIEENNFNFSQQKEWKNWKNIQQKNTDKAVVDSTEEEVKRELPEGKWEMPNTGLVILHPFLKQLFTGLGYISPSGKFKSATEMQRAVLLLHYLATGKIITEEETIDEIEFTFPKILCGFPVTEVIVPSTLTKKEVDTTISLLKACLIHWEKLKKSSITSLRCTFLQRKGFLEHVENAYQLTVDKSGTDILLDSLPWSFSMIKLPWLKETIFTTWH